jgi:hypothetical protein
MTREELLNELTSIRNAARYCVKQRGDDRCWLDYIKLISVILPAEEIDFGNPADISDLTFIENCIKFKRAGCDVQKYKEEQDCHSQKDGDCNWNFCPQNKDGEPEKTGRHCPLDNYEDK